MSGLSNHEPMPGLPMLQKLAYGVGHVLNDLCASMWFSYLLIYFESVHLFSKPFAGYILLVGQLADALATPLVGYESDRINGCFGYGKRKSWHALGSLCVVISFPFIFMQCIGCKQTSEQAQFVYYTPFIIIFQFGWASTQISHLALIPELTLSDKQRVELNAIRYAFTIISNLAVYCLMWLVFSQAGVISGGKIVPDDAGKFREVTFIVVAVGVLFTLAFHAGTRERPTDEAMSVIQTVDGSSQTYGSTEQTHHTDLCYHPDNKKGFHDGHTWKQWLQEYQFYLMAILFMCTRLIVNLSQVYLPMFIMHTLLLDKKYIAIMPLIVFASGFLTSFLMKSMIREVGCKVSYVLGLILICLSCSWMWFMPVRHPKQMFGAAAFLGAGTSTILITSLTMTADMIGNNVRSGAFVYGAMSFTDKLSNGVAVVLIQHFHSCKKQVIDYSAVCMSYYRQTIVFVPAGVGGLAFIIILILIPIKLGKLRHGLDKKQPWTVSKTERAQSDRVAPEGDLPTGQGGSESFENFLESDERTNLLSSQED